MIRELWKNYLTSGLGEATLEEQTQLQLMFVNAFSGVGILCLIIFGVVNSWNHSYYSGVFELICAGIGIGNVVILRQRSRFVNRAADTILILMLLVTAFLFLNGGIANTGIFWLFVFPPLAFLLRGGWRSWLWELAQVLMIIFVELYRYSIGDMDRASSITQIRQLLIALLATTILVYLYEKINMAQMESIKEKTKALKINNELLAQQIAERKYAEESLQKQNIELEKIKSATLNILEDLKNEKNEVENARAKNEAIISNIGDGILTIDANSKITSINPIAGRMLLLEPRKTLGKKYDRLLTIQDNSGKIVPLNERPISLALHGQKNISRTYSYIRSDGAALPVSIVATPLIVDGKNTGAVISIRDIAEEAAIDRAKTEFVSLASHQLRTPLTAINWLVELLTTGDTKKLSSQQQKYLNYIHASSQRMAQLVDALLDVSRLDLGKFPNKPSPTNICMVVDSILEDLKNQITTKQLQIIRHCGKDHPSILIDPNLLRMVIQNLLSNSVKYTPPKGTVELGVTQKLNTVIFIIRDTGYGIPKVQQEKIFTKFFRADNIKTKVTEGTGLGLYIVKTIIEQNNGTISFTSEEGKGTTFTVLFPLNQKTSLKNK